ncbi:ATP-binding cassette domain-containing protein [Mycoplasma buteonis]|uniref:ATP-binding cassette domain-containing protein n=1 Tax=Mycoplasma buteonis TaxID=171280 RepID=UPI000A0119F4|nr:ATP-binding cassette domain-containing protein [Mycoplasma buteonis]
MEKFNAIEFNEISKYFGEIKANQDITFEVKKGSIHALIGENGAGKSTLMSILFGLYQPDKGTIKVNGKEVLIKGPNDANSLGIGMVHQHFKLVDVYTNLENIILGDEPYNKTSRVIDYKPAIQKIKTIQNAFNLHFDLNRITGKETVATQQKVEIMKMLYRDSEILIFDEPTAVLTDEEIQGLLHTFKLFREQGKTILFISHKLAEIKEVADNATVIRHGKVMGNFKVADVSIEEMARRMVGSDVEIVRNEYSDTSKNDVILKLEDVSTAGEKPLKHASLEIRAGEIVAIAGVEGNGQTDLEYVISGMTKPTTGSVLYRKTELVKNRIENIKKSHRNNKFINLGLSLFFAIIGFALLFIPFERNDLKSVAEVFAGFSLFLSVLFLFILLNSIFKFTNIFQKALGGKEAYREHFASQKYDVKFINNLNKIHLIAVIGFVLLALLSLTLLFEKTYFYGAIIVLVILIATFIPVIYLKVLFYKNYSKLFVRTNGHLASLILFELLQYGSALILLAFSFKAILSNSYSSDFIYPVIFALVLLFISGFGKLLFLSFTHQKDSKVADNDFIEISQNSVYDISKLGFSFIPSDRHKHGLVLDYNIKSNTVLRRLWDPTYVKLSILKSKAIKQENDSIIEKYDVRGARRGLSMARSLSGGNQQKFIVGREMNAPHDFILIVQPTRGLDVGAIKNIHNQILAEKQKGKAILLISYELDEVLALADKIAVINGGEILTVKEARDLTRTEIGIYMAHKGNSKEKNLISQEGRDETNQQSFLVI